MTEPVTVSLLFQQTDLHWDERNVLGSIVTDLAQLSQQRTDYDILNNPIVYPACMNAKQALQCWDKRIEQLHRPLLVRLAVRSDVVTAVTIATALATAVGTASGTSGTHPMYYEAPLTPADVRQANFSFDWLEILPWGGHAIWQKRVLRTACGACRIYSVLTKPPQLLSYRYPITRVSPVSPDLGGWSHTERKLMVVSSATAAAFSSVRPCITVLPALQFVCHSRPLIDMLW